MKQYQKLLLHLLYRRKIFLLFSSVYSSEIEHFDYFGNIQISVKYGMIDGDFWGVIRGTLSYLFLITFSNLFGVIGRFLKALFNWNTKSNTEVQTPERTVET